MKSLIQAVVVAAVLAAPVSSFAQSNQPVTRAQVRAELIQLEKAGYQPGRSYPYYPADIQAAQARVAAAKRYRTSRGKQLRRRGEWLVAVGPRGSGERSEVDLFRQLSW